MSRGFKDQVDYEQGLHRLGNLTLLEASLNSAGQNEAPETKAKTPNLYPASQLRTVRTLGIQIQQKPGLWSKSDIAARTATLVDFILGRWPLWVDP